MHPHISPLSVAGRFISVDSGRAVLESPDLELVDWTCLRLVYQITGNGSVHLHLRPEDENFDYALWSSSTPSDSWVIASVDLRNTSSSYKVRRHVRDISRCFFLFPMCSQGLAPVLIFPLSPLLVSALQSLTVCWVFTSAYLNLPFIIIACRFCTYSWVYAWFLCPTPPPPPALP